MAPPNGATKAIVCLNSKSNGHLVCKALTLSGTTLSKGDDLIVDASFSSFGDVKLARISTNKAVVCYSAGPYTQMVIKCNILSLSGTTLSKGADFVYWDDGSKSNMFLGPQPLVIDDSKVLMCFTVEEVGGGFSITQFCNQLTVSGTDLTKGDEQDITSIGTYPRFLDPPVMSGCTVGSGSCCSFTVSATGTLSKIANDVAFDGNPATAPLSSNHVAACYLTSIAKHAVCNLLTASGDGTDTVLSKGTPVPVNSEETSSHSLSLASLGPNEAALCYKDVGNDNYGTCNTLTLSGSTLTKGADLIAVPSAHNALSITALNAKEAVLCYDTTSTIDATNNLYCKYVGPPCAAGYSCLPPDFVPVACSAGAAAIVNQNCEDCAAGYHQPLEAQATCNICPNGTHQAATGQLTCNACPGGTYQPALGSTDPNDCLSCGAGTYSLSGSAECLPCPENTFSGSRASTCTQCPPGFDCPNGQVVSCEAGTFSTGSGGCNACTSGYRCAGSSDALACPIGEFCPAGAITGTPCTLEQSTTLEVGAGSEDECVCKPGFFLTDGQCADGAQTFKEMGVVDGIDFTMVGITVATLPLKKDYWRASNTTLAVGQCYTEGACEGATPGGTSASRRLQTTAELKSEDTFGAALCRTGHTGPYCEVCKPLWYKGADKLCRDCEAADGNLSVNIAYVVGIVVVVLIGIILMLCRGRKSAIAELMAGDVSEAGIEAKFEKLTKREGDKKAQFKQLAVSRMLGIRVRLKIFMSLIQVMSALGGVFEIAFPPIFSSMMKIIGSVQLDIFTSLPLACITDSGFHTDLLLSTLVPFGIMLLLALFGWLLMRNAEPKTQKGASRIWLGNVLVNLVFLLLFFLYPSISKKLFATFQCKDIGDGTRWLRADLSINCASPEHVGMTAYAAVMLFVYPFGAPALYAYLLFRSYGKELRRLQAIHINRNKVKENAVAYDEYIRWDQATGKAKELKPTKATEVEPQLAALEVEEKLLKEKLPGYIQTLSGSGYSLRVFYFEIIESFRKLSIVCVPVFFTAGSVEQLLFGLMICFLTFGMYTMAHPYTSEEDNVFAILAQVVIFFSLLSSIALATASPTGHIATGLDIGLTVLFCSPILLEIWVDAGCSCEKLLFMKAKTHAGQTPKQASTDTTTLSHSSSPSQLRVGSSSSSSTAHSSSAPATVIV